jgi:lysophospholipase L1-like esterase
MTAIRTLIRVCAAALLLAGAVAARNHGSAQPFRDGDIVTFVGDSITHGGTYHSVVALFYATRFPDRGIRFYNCGIGGDRASMIMGDARYRLNVDILGYKPTAATVMLGMNDIGHTDYRGKPGPNTEASRRNSLEVYRENMGKLIAALRGAGARLTLITPSIYDETTRLEKANPAVSIGGNAALGKCAAMVRQYAKENRAGLAEFYPAMNAINAREQKKDPAFTVVGPDRVHPGPVGHFVMAYVFLKAQGMPREVARVGVNARAAKPERASNCAVENVKRTAAGVEFDALEKALPFVTPELARPALDLVPFARDFNQETLAVSGLKQGAYQVLIDGEAVGEYTAAQLKAGVNLADNPKTPQYRQSAEATRINDERTLAAKALRDIVAQKYAMSRGKVDVLDPAALISAVKARYGAATSGNQKVDSRLELLKQSLDQPGRFESQFEDLAAALRNVCRPRKHHFAVVRKAG